MAAIITPTDLQTIVSTSGFNKIYLQFKTTDDKHFYPAAYLYNGVFPYIDVSSTI